MAVGGGTTTVNQFYPSSTAWSTANPIDIARTSPGVVFDGALYLVYGGQTGNTAIGDALSYDPFNIDNVQDAATMVTPRTQFGFAADDANHPFAIGGRDDQNTPLSSVTYYDVATNTWHAAASLPQSLYSQAAVNDGNGHILTFGGVAGGAITNNVYRYTIANDSWDTVAPMLVPERDGAAVLASNGRIYVIGGTSSSATLSTVQSYDPVADTWSLETSLPSPVSSAAAVTDVDGHIIVIGGYNQNHVATAKVFVSQVLTAPDSLPGFTSTSPASVMVASTYVYQVATAGNPQATYSLVNAPAGMTIDQNRGLITWTPTVAQAGLNAVTVRATNFVGSTDQTFSVRALTPAPTVPTGLAVTSTTTNSVSLSWSPSSDGIGVAGYRVYRVSHTGFHGITTVYTKVSDVPGTSTTITGLTSGTSYQYVVSAYNASGNESGRSASVSVRTQSPVVYIGPTSVNVVANHPLSFTLSVTANPAIFTFTALDPADGMTVDANTGLVSWTPSDADVGTNYFNYRIDHTLGSITVQVAIQVGINLPYQVYTPGTGAMATQLYTGQFSQTVDPYNTSPVTFSLVSGPAGMTIDASTGLLSWTPTVADIGTASATVQISNYAGSTSNTVSIPVAFASAAQNVAVGHISTTSATVTWDVPAVASEPIASYQVTASYRVQSGRFQTTHTLTFSAAATDSSIVISGLPTNKSISVAVTALDATGRAAYAGRTSFTTATAIPIVTISAGPFTYDGLPHAATATAVGTNGVTPVPGSFAFTYNGSSVPPTTPGSYAVVSVFISTDPYYGEAVTNATLTISPATPTINITGGPFNYDGQPHAVSATAIGIDGTTAINGSATVPSGPGVIDVVATFTSSDPFYTSTTATGTLIIRSTGTQVPTLNIVGGPFTYDGTAHAVTATAKGAGQTPLAGRITLTYDGSTTAPTAAGIYTVVATFASADVNYRDGSLTGSLTIAKAATTANIGWLTYPGSAPSPTIIFDGQPHEATALASGVSGQAVAGSFTFTYSPVASPINAGNYAIQANFVSADSNYANASFSTTLSIDAYLPYIDVAVDAPAYTWYYGAYYATFDGTAFGATATVYGVWGTPINGSFNFTYYAYDPITYDYTTVLGSRSLNAGSYLIQANYTSNDPNYASTVGSTYLYIDQAIPTFAIGGSISYDGAPHDSPAIAYGVDGVTPIAGTFTFTYNGTITVPVTSAGVYAVDAYFASNDPNYSDGSTSDVFTINKITPVFSNLSSPTANVGAASTSISGHIEARSVYPNGELVAITVNGVSRNARVGTTGNFSVAFPTGTLAIGSYPITFAFAGNATGFNSATNGVATLSVVAALVAPRVTTNPTSQTIVAGNTVTFTVAATGSPTPTVQWQVSTNAGTTYSNIAGATSASLTLVTVASLNSYRYRAVFTNSVGTATTTAATLTVQSAPTVTTNPVSQAIRSGSNVTFTVAATGNPTPTVQWQLSTNGGLTFANIAGATNVSYSFTTATSQNGNVYRAVFTNSVGSATSSNATLTVQTAPVVTTNPATQTVVAGNTVTFTAAASGNPAPTVQWQVSTNAGTSYSNVAGATNLSLSFTAAANQSAYRYRAVFTNSVGTATTTAAILTVQSAPIVTTNPISQTVAAGTRVTFTAAATGNPAPTVQWQVSTNGGTTFANVAGATSTTLSFTTTALQRGNRYRAVFTNSLGQAITTAAILTV
jgi:hypothetical protein